MFEEIFYKEKIIKEHLSKVGSLIDQHDKLELDYKEILFDSSAAVASNTEISFNDSVKVTYEE